MLTVLYIISLVILPGIGWLLLNYISVLRHLRIVIWIVLIFVIHNVLYFNGYSFRGDNADYVVFALEYPFFLFVIRSLTKFRRNTYTRTLKGLGFLVMVLGIIWGGFNSMFFIATDMDYVSDQKISFHSKDKGYEVRRYSFGFATLENTRYTFDTYRSFKYLPFEHLIDRTILWDNKIKFNVSDDLKFDVHTKNDIDTLIILSNNVEVFRKRTKLDVL